MRIEFHVDGGFAVFPGLARPLRIDVDALPASEADALRSTVDRSRFFERPACPTVAGADRRCYSVTVDDGSRCRTLTFPDTAGDPDLDALVALLKARRRDQRTPLR